MDVRVALGVAMWFLAWTTMLGGLVTAFSLPRDHREDVRVELRARAAANWDAEQKAKSDKENAAESAGDPNADEATDYADDKEVEVAQFVYHISEKHLTELVRASAEFEHVQAQARVAMSIGIIGAVFFILLVVMAALKEHKQPIEDEAAIEAASLGDSTRTLNVEVQAAVPTAE